jgi:cysteine desulfurase
MSIRPIYLDSHATTPLDERVLNAMIPYFTEKFGNPASNSHVYGWEGQAAVKRTREVLSTAINCTPEEIVFTSGATEANNLAIKGIAEAYFSKGQHIVTVATEHKAVLDTCEYLKTIGFQLTILPVEKDGLIDLEKLEKSLRADTILVSVMAANNEIGVLQPLSEIGRICHQQGVIFHSDAAQAIGKISLDVEALNIDLMSLTAHKVYGPKGIGALYVRRKNPRVKLAPQQHGGGHERGMRSGTLYTPQIVGFGTAIEIALEEQKTENFRLETLRERLWKQISKVGGIHLNGHPSKRLAGNLNISVEGIDGAALSLGLQPVVAVSSGSACSSHNVAPSYVLTALGHPGELAHASVRFGIGRFNTVEEIDKVAAHFVKTVEGLRFASVVTC